MTDFRLCFGHGSSGAMLSDYVDGTLDDEGRERVRDHLSRCAPCSDLVGDLTEIASVARAAGPVQPSRDLWPGIAERLAAPDTAQRALEVAEGRPVATDLAVRATRAQLAAAAVFLVTLSGSLGWWIGGGYPASTASAVPGADVGAAVALGVPDPQRSNTADVLAGVEGLADVLSVVADRLGPSTLDQIARNLLVIEGAIEESRGALALDPRSPYLRAHLERVTERRAEYVVGVARLLEGTE